MAERMSLIHANVEWLLHFAESRYVKGVNIPLPGGKQVAKPPAEEDKAEVPMEVEEDPLLTSLQHLFPSYLSHSNYSEAYAAACAHIPAGNLQSVLADPELLKMLVTELLAK